MTTRRSRLDPRDAARESMVALLARPGRTALTVLGSILGIGALVATVGIAQTAGSQIVARFDALAATSILAAPATPDIANPIPWDGPQRVSRLNGVAAAGTTTEVDIGDVETTAVPINDPAAIASLHLPVVAASVGLFDAVEATIRTGRIYDTGHDHRHDAVAVLGPAAAQQLNIHRVDHNPAIFLGDQPLTVIGILDNVQRQPGLLESIIIPNGTAQHLYNLQNPGGVFIRTQPGFAPLIAAQAPLALNPSAPQAIGVQANLAPRGVREAIATDVDALFLSLGALTLVVGAIGIANVTLVSVMERTGEIGLRRSVGALRRHIAVQFLLESSLLGAAGGIIGTSLGTLTITTVALIQDWTPTINLNILILAPILGILVGAVSGVYPAWKAAKLDPAQALTTGV